MLRTTLLLLTGAAAGAAGLHLVRTGFVSSDSVTNEAHSPRPSLDIPLAPRGDARGEQPPDSLAALEARVVALAEERPSGNRTVQLAALLIRYAETDPAAAARLSRRVRADDEVTRLLFTAWAEHDIEAAMAELGASFGPGEAREVAGTLLRSLGNDDDRALQLARFLPAEERNRFLADAVVARGNASPLGAFRQALTLDDAGARGLALRRLAQTWGRIDPRQALSQLPQITNTEERTAFRDGVLMQWVQAEPGPALDYALELDATTRQRLVLGMAHQLPNDDVARVLAVAARLDGQTGTMLRQTVIQRLAQSDPRAALGHIELLPAHERRQVQISVAHAYGAKDPEAAFAWAQSIQPREPQVLLGVLNGIAQTNPDRAFDLALSLGSPSERDQAISVVSSIGHRGGTDAERMLNRVLALDDRLVRNRAVLGLLGSWSVSDPERAFEWLAANQHQVPEEAYQQVAMQLANLDPATAASYTDRVPQGARASWIGAVATNYAQRDPQAAFAWLAQYRGDPAYREALTPVVGVLARVDGAAAVRLLEESGGFDRSNPSAVMNVVTSWSQQDPAAAAAWATTLDDVRVRTSALSVSVQQWNLRDPDGARRWAFGLPPGELRDGALTGLVNKPFPQATLDEELLAAFSSELARNRALVMTAMQLAQTGSYEQGRALLEQRVTDAAERAGAIGMLEQVRNGRPGAVGPALNPAFQIPGSVIDGPRAVIGVRPPEPAGRR